MKIYIPEFDYEALAAAYKSAKWKWAIKRPENKHTPTARQIKATVKRLVKDAAGQIQTGGIEVKTAAVTVTFDKKIRKHLPK